MLVNSSDAMRKSFDQILSLFVTNGGISLELGGESLPLRWVKSGWQLVTMELESIDAVMTH
mgnify:CR=1 FL=1